MTNRSLILFCLIAIAGAVTPLRGQTDGGWAWSKLTPAAGSSPEARRNGTAVYDPVGHRIVVFGGTTGARHFNDVWTFDLSRQSWTRVETLGIPPDPRLGHDAVYDPVGHQMIVWAGQQGNRFFNDTWALDLTTFRWTDISPPARPRARYGSASVYDPGRRALVQFAGFTEEGNRFQDTQAFLIDERRWMDLTPAGNKPQVRCLLTAALDPIRRRMLIYGGQRNGHLDDLWAFDLTANSWLNLTPSERPAGRFFASSFVDRRGQFLVFGGSTPGGNVNETWEFDPEASRWQKLEIPGPPPARNGMMGAYVPSLDRFVLFGGSGTSLHDDVWELRREIASESSGLMHFGQVANGDSWTSVLILTNPSSDTPVSGSVSFFSDAGDPLALPFEGGAPRASVSFGIPPLGRVTLRTDGGGNLVSGWARVAANRSIAGVIELRSSVLGTAGVGASAPVSNFITPITRTSRGELSTGIAVAAVSAATTLKMTLRDSLGEVVSGGEAVYELYAQGHFARFVEQLFPDAITAEFEGTLTVESAGGRVVATAIQLGSRELTTLPVSPLR